MKHCIVVISLQLVKQARCLRCAGADESCLTTAHITLNTIGNKVEFTVATEHDQYM